MIDSSGGEISGGRHRNRPARKKAAVNSPAETDGRRKTISPMQIKMQERALRYQRQLAENVRTLRTSRGWSQLLLGEKVGWFRTTIIRIETGERCPSYGDVCILADVLGVSVDSLSKDLSWMYSMANSGTLPEALRTMRLAENLTQGEVAETCDMTRAQYIAVESGKVTPDADMMAKLTRVFGRPIAFSEAC